MHTLLDLTATSPRSFALPTENCPTENVVLQRRYSHATDKSTGVRSDQTVILATVESARAYPEALLTPDLDRRLGLCAGRHRRQAIGIGGEPSPILQVLSITLFENTPILRALQTCDSGSDLLDPGNQFETVGLLTGQQ